MRIGFATVFRTLAAIFFVLSLNACSSQRAAAPPKTPQTASAGGYYKVGQPYQIKGEWYYPKEDFSYDETGIASWYGDDFHDKKTANGEIFNKNELTAAHATLPMPSLARVTNLENGRSIVVRVNDRGPVKGKRILDTSHRVAQLLGFERQGTAKVRVQVLADESKAIADAMRRYGGQSPQVQLASAQPQLPPETLADTGPAVTYGNVQSQPLDPLPVARADAKAVMASIKPVEEVHQLPVTGQQQIYIQAGAFTQIENAANVQKKLASLGQVRVANADVKGLRFYRVRVGPVPDVPSADRLLQKVVQTGYREARIIVD